MLCKLFVVSRARRARAGADPAARWDLRVVVSGGQVVGGARRVAAPGEWRTNIALGGHIEAASPPPLARKLALEAAAAIRGDLVGIDLLPLGDGFVVSEVNGAVDFRPPYALGPGNVFRTRYTSSCASHGSAEQPPSRPCLRHEPVSTRRRPPTS